MPLEGIDEERSESGFESFPFGPMIGRGDEVQGYRRTSSRFEQAGLETATRESRVDDIHHFLVRHEYNVGFKVGELGTIRAHLLLDVVGREASKHVFTVPEEELCHIVTADPMLVGIERPSLSCPENGVKHLGLDIFTLIAMSVYNSS